MKHCRFLMKGAHTESRAEVNKLGHREVRSAKNPLTLSVCSSAVPSHQLLGMFRRVPARHRITPSYIHFISFKSNFTPREGFFFFFEPKIEHPSLFIGKGHFLQKCLVRIQILFPQQFSLFITWGLFWFLLGFKHISEAQAEKGVEEAYEWAYPLGCAEPPSLEKVQRWGREERKKTITGYKCKAQF